MATTVTDKSVTIGAVAVTSISKTAKFALSPPLSVTVITIPVVVPTSSLARSRMRY